MRHSLPDFVCGKAQNRRQHANQRTQDTIDCSLCRAAAQTIGLIAVQTILDHIEVEVGHINNTEIMNCMEYGVEFVAIISLTNLCSKVVQLHQCPLIQLRHICVCNSVGLRIKVKQVAQNVASRVTDLEVVLRQMLEHVLGNTHILTVVRRSNPQTHYICAILLEDILRSNTIAQRLGHLLALLINNHTVGDNRLVRSLALRSNRSQHRGLEPAAILVIAFQIYVNRGLLTFAVLDNSTPGGTGIKPYIHGVGFLVELAAAALTLDACRQDLSSRHVEPCVGALFTEQISNGLNRLLIYQRLAALLAGEDRNRNTPDTLTGNTPVGTLTDHGGHALLTPAGNPLDVFTSLDCVILERINRAEPLLGGTEDDRIFAAPTMRIAVHDVLGCEKGAAVIQILENNLVGIVNEHTLVLAGFGGVTALAVNRNDNRDVVSLANDKVISTKARSGMNTAGTGIERYMVTGDNQRITVEQRVLGLDQLQIRAENGCENFPAVNAGSLHNRSNQFLSQNINLAVRNLNEIVLEVRVQRNCKVARNGPGSGGPNYEIYILLGTKQLGDNTLVIGYSELYKDRLTRNILVLNLCLSQCGLVVRAPVNRLLTLVDVTLLSHLAENLNLSSLVIVGQGQVRAIPVADNAQTLKLGTLGIDMIVCKLFTLGAELRSGNLAAIHAVSLDCLTLNRKTMGIPARNVRSLITHHIARTQNKILEDLIQCVTHMQIAVCIRRAVVQNEKRLALVLLHQFMVEVVLLPVFQKTRLALRQTGTHREFGFGQIDRIVVILLHCAVFSPFAYLLNVLRVVFSAELQFAEVEFTRCIFHWCIALPSRICVLCIFSLLYRSEVFALRQLCQCSCLRLIQLCYMSDKLSSVLAGSLQFLFLSVDFRLGVFHLVCGFILRRSNDLLCFLLRLVNCFLRNRLCGQQGTVHSFFNTAVLFNFIDQHLHFCLHSSVFLLHRCKFLCNTLEKSIDRLHVISAENRLFKADFLYFLHRHMFFLRLYIICRTDTEKWSGCARPKSAPFVRQA